VNQNRRSALRVLGLKAVIATAEGFPSPESQGLLRDLFGCPIALEYGAVETAMLAHTRPGHVYQTFWKTYFVEAERQSDGSAGHTVRVTALYPRCFPLVRYELGDEIDLGEAAPTFVLGVDRFERVIGRCEDYVRLPDGFVVHSAAFTHVARSLPQITGYQVIQSNDSVRLTYTATGPVTDEQVAGIRERLTKIHPWLDNAKIVAVERLHQTAAGKTRLVIKDS
jgi:phenylacetate-coenzyme A ligase PaaK-like adenylate-forming protein